MNRTSCEHCGCEYGIGDWPYCPHDRAGHGMLGKFQPYWDEHICPEGAWITSLAERRRIMRERNLDYHGLKVGMPGCEV